MRQSMLSLVLMLTLSGWYPPKWPAGHATQMTKHFDGNWWSQTGAEKHSGFINGASDCLTWIAHKKGFNGTPEELVDKITEFYKKHPESTHLDVVEIWKRIWEKSALSAASLQPGGDLD